MLGLPICEIRELYVIEGQAFVPVILRNGRVFDQQSQTFFLLEPDHLRPGHQCLGAQKTPVPVETGKPQFRGFSSALELKLQIGCRQGPCVVEESGTFQVVVSRNDGIESPRVWYID
jgi:hypothetical protein